MLIRFIAENFLSFDEPTEFNMLSGANANSKRPIYEYNKDIKLLNLAAIYGANGSGKSNLVKGLITMQLYIIGTEYGKRFLILPFYLKESKHLDPSNFKDPIKLKVEILHEGKILFYELHHSNNVVVYERLDLVKAYGEDDVIFERTRKDGVNHLTFNKRYTETEKQKAFIEVYSEVLKTQAFANLDLPGLPEEVLALRKWFQQLIIINSDSVNLDLIHSIQNKPELKDFVASNIKKWVQGIEGLETGWIKLEDYLGENEKERKDKIIDAVEKGERPFDLARGFPVGFGKNQNGDIGAFIITTFHKDNANGKVPFSPPMESAGTNRLIDILPLVFFALHTSNVVVIDEIDQSLHPILTKQLLKMYVESIHDPVKGQLIFTTHEANLLDLDLLRKDEIWFTEKNEKGATEMYPLSDFKVRSDLDIQKGYLQGRFGAIPFLGNLDDLSWNKESNSGEGQKV